MNGTIYIPSEKKIVDHPLTTRNTYRQVVVTADRRFLVFIIIHVREGMIALSDTHRSYQSNVKPRSV